MKVMSKEFFETALTRNGIEPIDIPLDLKKASKKQLRELINKLYAAAVDLLETQIRCEIEETNEAFSAYYPYLKELGVDNDRDD